MKNIKWIVITMTIYVFFFAITPSLGLMYKVILFLFLLGNLGIIYMVYAVLKFGEQPEKKFSDGYWYGDIDEPYARDVELD